MEQSILSQYLTGFLSDTVFLAGIPLLVATVIGLVVAFLQAVTQIQDQTLGQTVKIGVLVFILLLFGASLISPLVIRTEMLFSDFGFL